MGYDRVIYPITDIRIQQSPWGGHKTENSGLLKPAITQLV